MRLKEELFSKKIKLTLILIFFSTTTFSQLQQKVTVINRDSILTLLPKLSEKEKTKAYFSLSETYYISNPDSALFFSEKAWYLSQKANDKNLIGTAGYYFGKAYYFNGEFNKAIYYYLPAYDYAKETKNMRLMLMLDEALVFAYFYSGNAEVTKNHLEVIVSHLKYLPDSNYLAYFTIGIGYFYRYLQIYEQAIQFFLQYEKLHLAHHTSPKPLAICYGHLGYCYEQIGDLDKALKYYSADIKLISNLDQNTRSYLYMGNLYAKLDSLPKAINYYKEAIEFYDSFGNVHFKALSALKLGNVYMRLGRYTEALATYEQALATANWIQKHKMLFTTIDKEVTTLITTMQIVGKYKENEALKLISEIHFQLYQLYLKQYKTKKALDEYILYHQTFEEQNLSERIISIEEIKNKYESEKKDQQITVLSQQNQLNELKIKQTSYLLFGLAVLVIMLVVVFILIFRQNKLKAKQKTILLQQKLLRSQMNPHFIFNALSNISNLIDKNDNTTASNYLTRFSRLVRHILESTRSDFIELDQEITNLENYLALQKLRFAEKFDYKITVDDEIDVEEIKIPPMLIQPFVENAIEHGIKPRETKGHIDIRFMIKEKQLICEVDDDGVGREKARKLIHNEHKSMATAIIQDRLETLSRKMKHNFLFEIIDLTTDANVSLGTKVVIGLPIRII